MRGSWLVKVSPPGAVYVAVTLVRSSPSPVAVRVVTEAVRSALVTGTEAVRTLPPCWGVTVHSTSSALPRLSRAVSVKLQVSPTKKSSPGRPSTEMSSVEVTLTSSRAV